MTTTVIFWWFNNVNLIDKFHDALCSGGAWLLRKEEGGPSRVHTLQEYSLSALLEGELLHGIYLSKTEEYDI